MSGKLTLLLGLVALALFLLAAKIIKICTEDYDAYAVNVMSNYSYTDSDVSAPRGTITDRNGNILAYSEASYLLILEPKIILNEDNEYKEATVQALCKICGLDEAELLTVLEDNSTSLYYRYRDESTEDRTVMIFTADVKSEYEDMVSAVNVSKTSAKLTALAELFDMTEDEVKETYPDYAEFQLQGVYFERRYDRVYPYGSLASKVIGYYSEYYTESSTGIEKSYDVELTGIDGQSYSYMNGDYNVVTETVEPEQGSTIVSTIDIEVQSMVEEILAEYTDTYDVKNIAAIVMNPNNGEIIAMADGNSYNLNDPTAIPDSYTEEEWNEMTSEEQSTALYEIYDNYCISSSYEPGSIFKPITIAAAVEEGALLGDEEFYCGGATVVNGWTIRCHNRDGCGTLDIFGALANSCNVSLIQIVNLLGKEDFTTYFNRFGFGQLTGIDLPDEVDCSSLVYSDFTTEPDVTLATASFGQGFNVTMIQMAAAMSSVVNGGYYYTPHVVKEVTTADGVTTETYDTTAEFTTISAETSEYMREALYDVVEDGTGGYVRIEGYNIGGKTGTAEKVVDGKRADDTWVLSFISFAPIEDPELMVYVVVDETSDENLYNSSKPAQDIAKAIWAKILPYYNIQSNSEYFDYLNPEESVTVVDDSYDEDVDIVESSTDEEETEDDTDELDETDESVEGTDTGESDAEGQETAEASTEGEVPAEETSETSSDEVPVEEIPVEDTSADAAATESVAEEVPADTVATDVPVEEIPTETAATEVPVEEVPAETAATEAPVEEVPAETAATEAPVEEVPAETAATEVPVEGAA